MAHFWFNDGQEWPTWPLDMGSVRLSARGPEGAPGLANRDTSAVLVLPSPGERWTLLAGADARVRVNGLPTAGICVLEDRDEIRIWSLGGSIFFYSSERKAAISPYQGNADAVCPRCQQGIEPGTPAVDCPRCSVSHHETEALACWTYDDKCAVCSRTTQLNAPYKWQPEALWQSKS